MMLRLSLPILLVLLLLPFFPASAQTTDEKTVEKVEEKIAQNETNIVQSTLSMTREVARRAHLTYALTELNGLKERIEAHRLEPKKIFLADFDRKYYEQKQVPKDFEEAVSSEHWKEFTAESALIVWLRQDYLASADQASGYIYIDHLAAYSIENASVTWKAIDKKSGKVIHTNTVEELYVRPKALTRLCEIDFNLGQAGPLQVPTEVEIEAKLEFNSEERNQDCPFSTRRSITINQSGASPTKMVGGVFGRPGGDRSRRSQSGEPMGGVDAGFSFDGSIDYNNRSQQRPRGLGLGLFNW